MGTYAYAPFAYAPPPELRGGPGRRRPVVVVGGGPVGLTAAIDLALHGVPVVVLDENNVVSLGSRAICWAKRTLEIWDRLGVADRVVAKGVTWRVGRVYHRQRELYAFDLLPEAGHKMPAFVNLQQYYVEQYLVERAADFPDLIDLRWKNRVVGFEARDDGVRVEVETPDGAYALEADWLVAADGARSPVREMLGLRLEGQAFDEQFLIADVHVRSEMPSERRFWFKPEFDPAESVLLHRQPDDVFRVDFQLGPGADAEREKAPERVLARVRRVLGEGVEPELEWCSVYRFRCARLKNFVHGRVVFVGDSAHVVSPFGARGGNGGVQDADNLAWKLALVVRGEAPAGLIQSYDAERGRGADENILNSARTTRFMSPHGAAERRYRDGALALAGAAPFARSLVNGGRLSKPCALADPDDADAPMRPGSPCTDAPVVVDGEPGWLLERLGGGFKALVFGPVPPGLPVEALSVVREGVEAAGGALVDAEGLVRARYGGGEGVTCLIRPDQHVAARFDRPDAGALGRALERATGGAGGCP